MQMQNSFFKGLRDGLPIALGYLSVSFAFGMMATSSGLPVWSAVFISMSNLTSAGQFAGLSLMIGGGSLIEMALTQLIINLRYALMGVSLSQKLHKSVSILDRLLIAFGNTDETFAVASSQKGELGKRYLFGLILGPFCGWSLGTLIGALSSAFLPASVLSALGIAIYGMFLAIIIPPAKKDKAVLLVIGIAVLLSTLCYYTPGLNRISSGFVIILSTIGAAAAGALVHPLPDDGKEEAA